MCRPLFSLTALGCALSLLCAPLYPAHAADPQHPPSRVRVAVMDLVGEAGVSDGTRRLLNELLLTRIQASQRYQVFGVADMRAMLDFEQQKQLTGCEDDSCLAEIGGALGVERLVAGSIGAVGDLWLINLKCIDIAKASVQARVTRKVPQSAGEGELVNQMEAATDELLAALPEARQSAGTPWYASWWFWTGVGVAAAAGAGVGIWASTQEDERSVARFTVERGQ